MKISLIIPFYNEEEHVEDVMKALKGVNTYGLDVEFFMVENGSNDTTAMRLAPFCGENVKLISIPENHGYGYGLRQAILQATGYYIGWMHGNGKVSPLVLDSFFCHLSQNQTSGYFLKAERKGRSTLDNFFTKLHAKHSSSAFRTTMRDVNAVPMFVPSMVVQGHIMRDLPGNEAFDVFVYKEALSMGLHEIRIPVECEPDYRGLKFGARLGAKLKKARKAMRNNRAIKNHKRII